jgi:hypothetical protein
MSNEENPSPYVQGYSEKIRSLAYVSNSSPLAPWERPITGSRDVAAMTGAVVIVEMAPKNESTCLVSLF